MTTISSRRFLLAFALTLATLVATLTAHSVLVDPFGLWGTRILPEKGYSRHGRVRVAGDRIVKALALKRGNYDLVIVGSSRALFGFDPAHPSLASRRAFNSAFAGATAVENAGVLDASLAWQPGLTDALIGLDLFAFSRPKSFGDYDQSPFAGASAFAAVAARIISKEALSSSAEFWKSVRGKAMSRIDLAGFQDAEPEWLRDRRRLFLRTVGVGTSDCNPTNEALQLMDQGLSNLAAAARRAKARGVNLHFYLSPMHVWAHALEWAANRADLHEAFKRKAADFVRNLAIAPGSGRITLWDFDTLDPIATESVPEAGSKEETRYFWEPSHFRRNVGDGILAAMLGGPGLIEGFGARLDGVDIEAHLERVRSRRAAWVAGHAQDMAVLGRLAAMPRTCRDGVFQGYR